MFTGIIAYMGKVVSREGARFTFSAEEILLSKLDDGTSISVNGVCLTVLHKPTGDTFAVEVMPETEAKTMLGDLQEGDIVNLELPATPETFLSGHIVQGHVDGVGTIKSIFVDGNSRLVTIRIPQHLSKYMVDKGSICVNGISLTIITASSEEFSVGIIPFTWEHTMLSASKVGDKVNIETDVFAKYVEKLLQK